MSRKKPQERPKHLLEIWGDVWVLYKKEDGAFFCHADMWHLKSNHNVSLVYNYEVKKWWINTTKGPQPRLIAKTQEELFPKWVAFLLTDEVD